MNNILLLQICTCFILSSRTYPTLEEKQECRLMDFIEPMQKLQSILQWLQKRNFNFIREETNILMSSLPIDSSKYTLPTRNIQSSEPNLKFPGHFALACGRKYFFSDEKVSVKDAWELCPALDMELSSIKSVDNLFCLSRYAYYMLKMNATAMWTSGKKKEKKLALWDDNILIDPNVMTPPVPGIKPSSKSSDNKNCFSVLLAMERIAQSGVQPSTCTDILPVLCQIEDIFALVTAPPTTENPTCYMPSCPPLNCSYTVTSGKLALSNFIALQASCSKGKYFLSKATFTFAVAQSECCKINMSAVSFNNSVDVVCVKNMLLSTLGTSGIAWTSGTSQDCKKIWHWCSSKKRLRKDSNMWARFQPDNRHDHERCITVGKNLLMMGLHDMDCDTLYPVVCEAL